jgi:hypothetical protein
MVDAAENTGTLNEQALAELLLEPVRRRAPFPSPPSIRNAGRLNGRGQGEVGTDASDRVNDCHVGL